MTLKIFRNICISWWNSAPKTWGKRKRYSTFHLKPDGQQNIERCFLTSFSPAVSPRLSSFVAWEDWTPWSSAASAGTWSISAPAISKREYTAVSLNCSLSTFPYGKRNNTVRVIGHWNYRVFILVAVTLSFTNWQRQKKSHFEPRWSLWQELNSVSVARSKKKSTHLKFGRRHWPTALPCHSYICWIVHTLQRFSQPAVLRNTGRHVGHRLMCNLVLWLLKRTFFWQIVVSGSSLLIADFCLPILG